jgi:Restriction endonuclease
MAGYTPTQIHKPSNETEFEKHCVVLFKDVLNDPNLKRLGTRGQGQDGVDIIGNRDGDSARPVGIQCKLKSGNKKLTKREVKTEVEKALLYQPALTEYFIITTAKDDTRLDQLGQQLAQDQEKAGRKIRIIIWGWDTLEERIDQYPGMSRSMLN